MDAYIGSSIRDGEQVSYMDGVGCYCESDFLKKASPQATSSNTVSGTPATVSDPTTPGIRSRHAQEN